MIDSFTNQKREALAAAHENAWRRAERDILRRERSRLIQNGTITPVHRALPQPMVKDKDGRWWPNANFVKETDRA